MKEDKITYIQKSKLYIKLMLNINQWSGIEKKDIDLWLSNFSDFDDGDKYYIYKLLVNIIYFSEDDVLSILKDGIYNSLFYDDILQRQLEAGFQLRNQFLDNMVKSKISESYFIPLLDASKPHESGLSVMRQLVQNEIIKPEQSCFDSNITCEFDKSKYKQMIIVDDCVGSGNQITDFWNKKKIKVKDSEILFKNWILSENISVKYLTLFGYDKNIDKIQKAIPELKIICAKMLSDIHRVFNNPTYIWSDINESLSFQKILTEININSYGYDGLDFAFVMHKTIPDWSLPIFWKDDSEFNCLLRRKNSNVRSVQSL